MDDSESIEHDLPINIPPDRVAAVLATDVVINKGEMVWLDFIQTIVVADPIRATTVARVVITPSLLPDLVERLTALLADSD